MRATPKDSAMTPKQEAFAVAYVKDSTDAIKAWRSAYSGANSNDLTARKEASKLLKNPKVAARIAELRLPAAERAGVTLEGHLSDLQILRDEARERGQYAAAISAEIARGKASGVAVEKSETLVTTKTLPSSVDEFVMDDAPNPHSEGVRH
jgi:phage terminase small subunit